MKTSQHSKTLEYYTKTHNNSPGTPEGLDWSKHSQKKRFQVLLEGIKNREEDDSILDVGCGYGDILSLINWTGDYHGIDLNPLMIETAQKKYPQVDFRVGTVEEEKRKYDWVISSGIFNIKADDNQRMLQDTIQAMWKLCRKGIVFNVLIKGSEVQNSQMHFYDPGLVLNYCRTITPRVVCLIDYLPHDATFGLYRSGEKNTYL